MPLLSVADTASIAADMVSLFPESCTIQRATNTTDGLGGRTQAWATASTTTCRVRPINKSGIATDEPLANVQLDQHSYRVAFPLGTDVRITDRVACMGLTLAVQGLGIPASLGVEVVTDCKRAAV